MKDGGSAVVFVLGFPLIMGSRLLLNLREIAERDQSGSLLSVSLPTIHIAAGRSGGTHPILSIQSEVC